MLLSSLTDVETESPIADLRGGAQSPPGPQEEEHEGSAESSTPLIPALAEMGFWGWERQGSFSHYPVVIKLAGDDGRSQGAGRIHGAARVVDLQQGEVVKEGRGESPWASLQCLTSI